jgi:hypothetical protein
MIVGFTNIVDNNYIVITNKYHTTVGIIMKYIPKALTSMLKGGLWGSSSSSSFSFFLWFFNMQHLLFFLLISLQLLLV